MSSDISCAAAKQIINQGGQLVDVRTPAEYARSALPESINVPLQTIDYAHEQLDPLRPVVLYCHSGARSATAEDILEMMGFEQVHNLGAANRYYQCE